ncbi:MAG TPA: hypothetical protein DD738_05845 [Ruminiclostridium sp.]|jgi:hypothetical protein|nr:hypothetical protein [Ruminiclostridium sp.]
MIAIIIHGTDVAKRKAILNYCPKCRQDRRFWLIERSEVLGFIIILIRFSREYHTLCDSCNSTFFIPENVRKKIYLSIPERVIEFVRRRSK